MNKSFKLSLVFLMLLIVSSFAFAIATTGNQLWATLQDGNVSSFDVYGGVTGTEGVVNGAFDFDGIGGHINTNYAPSNFNVGSISLYYKGTDSFSGYEKFVGSVAEKGTNDPLVNFEGRPSGTIDLQLRDNSGTTLNCFGDDIINDGVEHHIVATWESGSIKTYVDGTLDGSCTDTFGDIDLSGYPLFVGGANVRGTAGTFTEGDFDEVKVFDKALNQSEVAELYNSGTPVENTVAEENLQFYASFDSLYDQSSNNNSLSAYNGVTYDADPDSYDFDGTDDYLDLSYDLGTPSKSISFWNKPDFTTWGTNRNYFGTDDAHYYIVTGTNDQLYLKCGATSERSVDYGGVLPDWFNTSKFSMFTMNCNSTNLDFYVDGVLEESFVYDTGIDSTSKVYIGSNQVTSQYFDGSISGFAVYNRTLSSTEITQLYAEGREYNPYAEDVTGIYVPKVTVARQTAPVEVITSEYATILTGTIEVDSTANISAGVTASVFANGGDSTANCEISLNDTQIGYSSTTPPNNDYRSIYINSETVERPAGTYNLTVNCKNDGITTFDIEDVVLLMTQYVNDENIPLNERFYDSDLAINSTIYQNLSSFSFNTSNLTIDNGTERYVLFESSLNYNYESTGTICVKGSAVGLETVDYCRYGIAGESGSGGAFTMVFNISQDQEIVSTISGRGTTADGSVNISTQTYEIIAHPNEINYSQLTNVPINSSSFIEVASMNISNDDHVSFSSVTKGSFSVKSLSGSSELIFRLSLRGDDEINGSIIKRDLDQPDEDGILSIQEIFDDLPIGNYQVILEASASNSDALITGGQLHTFTANDVPFIENTFNITAKNKWTNETITNFSVNLNGLITISDAGTGVIQAPVIGSEIDVTLIREGHPSKLIEDHNPILALEVELGDNYVSFYDEKTQSALNGSGIKVSLENGTNLSLTTDANGRITFEYYESPYLFTVLGKDGYVTPITFNYTATSTPFNISYNVSRINLTLFFYDEETSSLLDSTTVDIELISDNASYKYNTTNGTFYTDYIAPGEYTLRYGASGYTTRYYYFEATSRNDITLNLYLLNSSSTDLITVTVINQEADALEGALVKSLKYDITTNTYILQQSISTDSNGEAVFSVRLGEEFYYFIVEYPAGTQLKQTSPSLIYSSTLLIQVQTQPSGGTSWQNTLNINHNITWYNDTNEFTFRYNDQEGTVSEGCFYIYDSKYSGKSLIDSVCANGASNTLTLNVSGDPGSYYVAKGYVKIEGGYTLLEELQKVIPLAGIYDYTSLFFVAILLLAFAMTAIKTGPAAVVLLPMIGLMGVKLMGLLSAYVTWGTVFSLSIVAIIISVILKRRTGL